MDLGTVERNLRLIYLFQLLKSLQLFGAVTVPFYLEWGGLDYTRMFVLEGALRRAGEPCHDFRPSAAWG